MRPCRQQVLYRVNKVPSPLGHSSNSYSPPPAFSLEHSKLSGPVPALSSRFTNSYSRPPAYRRPVRHQSHAACHRLCISIFHRSSRVVSLLAALADIPVPDAVAMVDEAEVEAAAAEEEEEGKRWGDGYCT